MNDRAGRGLVLVTGASSQVGVFLLPRLVESGYRVHAVSRRAGAKPLALDSGPVWMQPGTVLEEAGRNSGHGRWLVSAGPPVLTSRILENCPALEKVVQFTTTSILTKSCSADPAERELVNQIAREESRLKQLCARQSVPLVILRPTLIYGCGTDRNLSRLWHWGNRTGFIPVAGRSGGQRQPVHAQDLAGLAVDALNADTGEFFESAACGGTMLAYRDMVAGVAACCRRKTRVVTVPTGLFAAGVRMVSWFGNGGLNPEMVRRQALDMVFDDSALREKLDYRPRPFQPAVADFSVPVPMAAFQLPG